VDVYLLESGLDLGYFMEITEQEKEVIADRAVQIQTGAIPLVGANVPLGLPEKPDPMQNQRINALVPNWTYSQLLATRKLVGTYPITTSTPPDAKIWAFRHTMQNVVDLHMRSMQNYFRIWRWNLHFDFEFRSNFQQVGQILIVNHTIPSSVERNLMTINKGFNKFSSSYVAMTQLPHKKIMMGEDVDDHEVLQWDAPIEGTIGLTQSYTRQGISGVPFTQYDMGEIFVIAPFQMQVASNVNPQMTVRIWSYLTDVGMSAYSPVDKLL